MGIGGTAAIILLYLLTRVVGIPLVGPEAWEVEGIGFIDACATIFEAIIVPALGALLLWRVVMREAALITTALTGALLLIVHLPHLLLFLRFL